MATNISRAVRVVRFAATFVAAALLQFIPTARADPTILPKLSQALAELPESKAVVISMSWVGLSPLSPIRVDYVLNLRNDQFEGVAEFAARTARGKRNIVVPHDLMRAFLAAVSKAELVEKPYQPRIMHTDDFPSISIGFVQEGVVVGTDSQQQKSSAGDYWERSPWAIAYAGRTFVMTASDVDKTFDALMTALQYDDVLEELDRQVRK
jgi:hypothetical protein